ncbi:MAG: metal-sensing transcriptional repressor [Candidatus Levybacteria bacterium]|nr:metal-sensing transcriptional repressor [Candidatus Levybacteria bacterium]
MYKPKDTHEHIVHRLKISQGHLAKVVKMVNNKSYCIDIIHQSKAVQNALKEVDSLILDNHLRTCVGEYFKSGKQEKAISELMNVFEKGAK